jgi:predicted RND superfamily exporter protein
LFQEKTFNSYDSLQKTLKGINGVEDIISVPSAVNLVKDSMTEKLMAQPIFRDTSLSQREIDSSKNIFLSLPFYKTILYNPETNAWLMGVRINKNVMNS